MNWRVGFGDLGVRKKHEDQVWHPVAVHRKAGAGVWIGKEDFKEDFLWFMSPFVGISRR